LLKTIRKHASVINNNIIIDDKTKEIGQLTVSNQSRWFINTSNKSKIQNNWHIQQLRCQLVKW